MLFSDPLLLRNKFTSKALSDQAWSYRPDNRKSFLICCKVERYAQNMKINGGKKVAL